MNLFNLEFNLLVTYFGNHAANIFQSESLKDFW